MKIFYKQTFMFFLFLGLIFFVCKQALADENSKIQYKTSKDLYDKCKSALSSDSFEKSFCAAYLEGYIGGSSTNGLYMLSMIDNQKKAMKNYSHNKCSKLDEIIYKPTGVKWLAKFFVGWIDNNPDAISGDSVFLDREASFILHSITKDERFCFNFTPQGAE